ncbi:MAG TPA: redoxin family protein [Bryobacteraceae bacterium]|nr:redoxin family protein [Bryobacteraceae bacterium]
MRTILNGFHKIGGPLPWLLACSLLINVALAHRLNTARTDALNSKSLVAGDSVPDIRGRSAAGALVDVRFANAAKPTIVYYFDPHCPWCKRNAANFNALASAVHSKYSVLAYTAVILNLNEYRTQTNLSVPVITDDATDIRRILKLHGTPQTMVVGVDGKVVKNWEGAYSGATLTDLEKYFNVRLPGSVRTGS